jgi:hypothetical protein
LVLKVNLYCYFEWQFEGKNPCVLNYNIYLS